ncbi:type I secretion system permease/ATPase [Vibrio ostreae]|uniref:Type I secretion system permease/ATPase n=1 Tax=Vibrio ostreae TaxID=2841925 RepID=A0A975YMF7_9VIBR|nr:type I secretion system permease/ATPase [Vibrio ostreae]QXO16441.1 type I secretion system permease/ATPase [Vibrio ostreae]
MSHVTKLHQSQAQGSGKHYQFQSRQRDPLREGLSLLCFQLGRVINSAELGDGLPLQAGKLPLEYVPRALHRAGIQGRVFDAELESLTGHLLPVLLLLTDDTTLLLVGWKNDQARLLLPESDGGEQLMPLHELQALYSGTAIVAKPVYHQDGRAGDFAQDTREHWLFGPLKSGWRAYLEVGVASLVANMLAVSTALFAIQVYDRVVPNDAFETLFVLASGVVIAVILECILRLVRAAVLDSTGKKLDLHLSSLLFERVMQIRLSAKPGSTGAFTSQVREFESVREFFTSSTAATISDLPFVLMFVVLIAYIGGVVAWVPVVAITLMLLPGLLLQGKLSQLSRANLREGAVKHGLLLETIDNLETVKATRAEGRNLQLWELLSAELMDDGQKIRRLSALLQYGAGMVQQLCYAAVVIVGVFQISAGNLTVGGLIACSILASRAIAPVNQVAGILVRWQHVKVALEGLDALMQVPVERPEGRQFARKPHLKGHYRLENLQFRYGDDLPLVLDIASLEIAAGSRVMLLGGNGSGKSSLLRLLAGMTDVTAGRLLLDDVALGQIEPTDRRQAIGYLPQDIALFYGSLRDNLLLDGARHADEELFEVLDAAGLGSAVRAHPLGLDMPIVGNHSVSGGQRQAIGLARIFLQDPAIVLMDEPSAAFDQASEARVIQHLQNWLQGRTLIMSTHKRSMLALGNRGVVLQNGKVTMDGPLDQLVSKTGTVGEAR